MAMDEGARSIRIAAAATGLCWVALVVVSVVDVGQPFSNAAGIFGADVCDISAPWLAPPIAAAAASVVAALAWWFLTPTGRRRGATLALIAGFLAILVTSVAALVIVGTNCGGFWVS